jgi:hypothetical protein
MSNLEIIREKLRAKSITIGTSRTRAFDAGEYHMDATNHVLAEENTRYIVAIFLIGDGSASRTVTIEKIEEDGTTYTLKFDQVPIAPADVRQIPQTYDIEHPILTLEGGTNLYFTGSAGSPKATIIYWDK